MKLHEHDTLAVAHRGGDTIRPRRNQGRSLGSSAAREADEKRAYT